jgi:hypothetical protein
MLEYGASVPRACAGHAEPGTTTRVKLPNAIVLIIFQLILSSGSLISSRFPGFDASSAKNIQSHLRNASNNL